MLSLIAYLSADFIGYTRVSTHKQAVKGNSLVAQKLQIREYAKAREIRISRWFTDETSARNEEEGVERPGLKDACALSLKTGKPIIVADLSRFSRTEKTFEDFFKAGGKIFDLEGFGDDENLMRARIKRAKMDGDRIAERTRKGQAKAREAGKKLGSPTPQNGARASAITRGKEADIRRRELERLQQEAVKDGVTTIKDLSAWLNGKGHSATQGKPWTPANVRRVLRGRLATTPAHAPALPFINDATIPSDDIAHFTPEETETIQKAINSDPRLNEAQRARWAPFLQRSLPRAVRELALKRARAVLDYLEAKAKKDLEILDFHKEMAIDEDPAGFSGQFGKTSANPIPGRVTLVDIRTEDHPEYGLF